MGSLSWKRTVRFLHQRSFFFSAACENGTHKAELTYPGMNREESHPVLKTVYSALFMLFCIDDTVSLGVSRHVIHSHFHSAVLRGNESDGEAKPFCCRFIHILSVPYTLPVLISPSSQTKCFTDHFQSLSAIQPTCSYDGWKNSWGLSFEPKAASHRHKVTIIKS